MLVLYVYCFYQKFQFQMLFMNVEVLLAWNCKLIYFSEAVLSPELILTQSLFYLVIHMLCLGIRLLYCLSNVLSIDIAYYAAACPSF